MSFDGGNDKITMSNISSIMFPNDYTVSAWFNPRSDTAAFFILKNGEYGLQWRGSTNSLSYYDQKYLYSTKNSWNLNQWYHVVMIKSGNTVSLYIDGIFDSSGSKGSEHIAGYNLIFGYYNSYFNGSLADVRVYNRALTQTEINTLYGSYKPKVVSGSLQKGLVLDMPLTSSGTKSVTAGSEIITDRTPYSNDGQNYGATVGASSTSFNGVGYINAGNSASLNITGNTITLSAWIKSNTFTTYQAIIGKRTSGQAYALETKADGNIRFGTYGVTNGELITTSNPLSLGQWHHVVGVYNGSNKSIYVDGVSVASISATGNITTSSYKVGIGSLWGDSQSTLFNGSIAGVRIYNRALSAVEVKTLYDKGR